MPPFSAATTRSDELREASALPDDPDYEEEAAGEDGLGLVASTGWDESVEAEPAEEPVEEIETWDD
jgi:hypothetical protein